MMAPDITEKKTKNCSKKYAYSAHSKYSKWEKDRRDRFNSKLDELAECLPNYSKESPWKKVEIIENAILTITTQAVSQNKVSDDTIRKLSNEVNNLKNIILQFTCFNKSAEDIYRVTSHEISSILSEILLSEKQQEETLLPVQVVTSPDKIEKSLAFVAKIAQSNDHCYSMNVSEQISGEVEVVESEVGSDKPGPQFAKVVGIVDTVETVDSNSQPQDETILTLVQDGSVVELPQLISFDEQAAPINCASNVRTIFVNEAPRPSVVFQPPAPPPPPPVIAEVVNDGRLVNKIAIPRLRLEKKKKKVRKTYTRTKPFVKGAKKGKIIKDAIHGALKDKSIYTKENPGVTDDTLINKEEIELLEETLKEDTENTEKAALSKDKKMSGSAGENAKRKLESLNKKKSKSSYSIAALCQISVNIGDRPEIANSPGVMSLNSVGTISPANTPGPATDTDKTFTLDPSCNIVIGTEPEETVIEELKTIIRPEDVSLLQQIEVTSSPAVANKSPSQSYLNSFPLVNKQHQLPCDKMNQREIYEALKDLDDIKELGMEREKSQPRQERKPPSSVMSRPQSVSTPVKEMAKTQLVSQCQRDQTKTGGGKHVMTMTGASSKTSNPSVLTKQTTTTAVVSSPTKVMTTSGSAMSVYDFSSTKPETPPIPLQESRKDSKSSAKVVAINQSGACKASYPVAGVSPDKKSYTELQSKAKKSAEELVIKKYPGDGRKSLADQSGLVSQQMSGQPQAGYQQSSELMYHQDTMQRQRQPYNSSNSGYPVTSRQYSSSHYPYQTVQHHANIQPYHHPYNHETNPDMKTQFQHSSSSKYSCSVASHSSYIHSDFHSRNYYPTTSKNYPGSGATPSNVANYRNFNSNDICPAPDPFNYKRTSSMATASNQQMSDMSQQLPAVDKTVPSTSSGTFSVTHLVNRDQRKGTKRSSTGNNKAAKQTRTETVKEVKSEKEEGRKGRTQSSRRNKSGNRSNYSAESLISSSGAAGTQTMAATSASPCKNANTKVNQNSDNNKTFSTSIKTASNWSNDVNHFSGLQLSSLSPSPANIFPTDLSSIDFQMSLFPQDPVSLGGKDYLQPSSSQNTKAASRQPPACQVTNQRSSVTTSVVPDWTLNTGILDNSFLPPIPTLTPPNDPMSDPTMSGYTFMSPMTHSSHSTGFYPTCAQTAPRLQNQSYSAAGQSKTTPAGHNTAFPPSQMVSLPPLAPGPNSQTGSLVNFNLSTIFPEINIAPGSQNCQGRSELLPHSLAIVSNMVPPSLVFSNNPEQQQ